MKRWDYATIDNPGWGDGARAVEDYLNMGWEPFAVSSTAGYGGIIGATLHLRFDLS